MSHSLTFLSETATIAKDIDHQQIERLASELAALTGTLYLIGLGGSAANCSHAAADLRRLCGIDARALVESVPELTAIANDHGWEKVFSAQLGSWKPNDALLVLSVGGGTEDVSVPIVRAVAIAKQNCIRVFGIVGRDGGYTAAHGDCVVVVPTVSTERVTPHTEAWHMVILHLLVSHPKLQKNRTKW